MTTNQPAALGNTTVHDIWSESVQDTFRVFVAECGENPQSMLFVTDANGLFGLTVDAVRLMQIPGLVPPMLVVGVGYPDAATLIDTVDVRVRDLTPTPSPSFPRSGGADDFIRFIRFELWPQVAAEHPAACANSTYFGHSLGGLFGAFVMLTQPATFNRYILSSPSLWWDHEHVFELARNQEQSGQRLGTTSVIGIGSLETDAGRRAEGVNLPEGHPAKPPAAHLDMVDDARRFASLLSGFDDLDLEFVEIADEFHATVPAVVLSRALRRFHR